MPGGRLSHTDRQRIAAWLAGGLTYSEIARRLDRPTSTVTREVTRNGGHHGYRPDQAQRATRQRARRGKPQRATAPADPDKYGRDPQAMRDLEAGMITVLVKSGFTRMPARVLTRILMADAGSLTAAELVQQLGVSPASISTAVRFLEEQELIRRERDPTSRRDRYVIGDDVWYRSMLASAQANAAIADAIEQGAVILGTTTPAGARLEKAAQIAHRINEELLHTAERVRQIYAEAY